MAYIDFLSVIHKSTHRDYLARVNHQEYPKAKAAELAKQWGTVFHYVPLHSSPAGRRYGRVSGTMVHTESISDRVLRLPLWVGMTREMVEHIVKSLFTAEEILSH